MSSSQSEQKAAVKIVQTLDPIVKKELGVSLKQIVKKEFNLIDKPSPSDKWKAKINTTREANTKILSSIQENDLRHFLSSGNSFKNTIMRELRPIYCPRKNKKKFRKGEA